MSEHAYTDRRNRNLCDTCDKWAGAKNHASVEALDYQRLELDKALEERGIYSRGDLDILLQQERLEGFAEGSMHAERLP